ncbi:hypothetical protein ACN28S_38950 [Cystobacter fuscus]
MRRPPWKTEGRVMFPGVLVLGALALVLALMTPRHSEEWNFPSVVVLMTLTLGVGILLGSRRREPRPPRCGGASGRAAS